ncbi:hypothetical protein OUZ56_013365 [Daphnia magna]|uniref:Uncharacterized protein n=1 Tax=Daphnia magna TaxID=35525 RepID=A0ABQ9Z6G3_9CRUS|nr:hypothetical protein OUZ56_013365 [Daphnia magna]
MLKIMIAKRKNDLHFFSTSEPSDTYNLETSMAGRQSVVHGYYDEISKHWMRSPLEIQVSSLSAPKFLSEENIPQLSGDMNKTEYVEAMKIMLKMYRCVTKFLGPVLRDYNLRNRGQLRCDPEIDVQALLFDLLDEWHKNHLTKPNF